MKSIYLCYHRNSRAVCLLLVQYGADINQEDGDGDTPLMLAEGVELKQAMMSKYVHCTMSCNYIINYVHC